MDVGVAAGASPTQITEQAFRRLRGYQVSLAAHPEYIGGLLGSPPKETMSTDELLPDQALREQFDYVGESVREDLGLPPPRFRLAPDPSVTAGWLVVQLHDQRRWPVRGLRPNDLLVSESARRVSHRGLETRAMQNPYTGDEGTEVPAASGPVLDAAGIPYWTAAAFTAIVTHLALRRRVETLIGPAEVEILLAELALDHPDLVALTTRQCTLTELTRVLRALVREGIPIRDLRTILEQLVLQEVGTVIDPDDYRPGDDALASIQQLTGRIRRGLHSAISGQFAGQHRRLLALRTDNEFQRRAAALLRSAEPSEEAREQLLDELWAAVQQASRAGAHPVVITSDGARWAVRCLVDSELPELPVLAESEIRNDIEVVLLPWTEARMTVEFLVVCDRVARFLNDSAGPSLRQDGPGTFSFSRGSAKITVEAALRHDKNTVITVSARPPVAVSATPAIFEWLATAPPERGVQVLLERNEQAFRPVCSVVLLGDFLDAEELEFALTMVTSVADEVQVDVERQDKVAIRDEETSAHLKP
jgi:FHIPEP family